MKLFVGLLFFVLLYFVLLFCVSKISRTNQGESIRKEEEMLRKLLDEYFYKK